MKLTQVSGITITDCLNGRDVPLEDAFCLTFTAQEFSRIRPDLNGFLKAPLRFFGITREEGGYSFYLKSEAIWRYLLMVHKGDFDLLTLGCAIQLSSCDEWESSGQRAHELLEFIFHFALEQLRQVAGWRYDPTRPYKVCFKEGKIQAFVCHDLVILIEGFNCPPLMPNAKHQLGQILGRGFYLGRYNGHAPPRPRRH